MIQGRGRRGPPSRRCGPLARRRGPLGQNEKEGHFKARSAARAGAGEVVVTDFENNSNNYSKLFVTDNVTVVTQFNEKEGHFKARSATRAVAGVVLYPGHDPECP